MPCPTPGAKPQLGCGVDLGPVSLSGVLWAPMLYSVGQTQGLCCWSDESGVWEGGGAQAAPSQISFCSGSSWRTAPAASAVRGLEARWKTVPNSSHRACFWVDRQPSPSPSPWRNGCRERPGLRGDCPSSPPVQRQHWRGAVVRAAQGGEKTERH